MSTYALYGNFFRQMAPDQIKSFVAELGGNIQQLRSLKHGIIGLVYVGKSHDSRLDGSAWGPVHGMVDFHAYIRLGHPLTHWEDEQDMMHVHSKPEKYSIKFTHAELRPNNILWKTGHITAIIDRELPADVLSIGSTRTYIGLSARCGISSIKRLSRK